MLSRFFVSPEVRREVGSALCALGGRRTDLFLAGGGGGAASLTWLGGSGGRLWAVRSRGGDVCSCVGEDKVESALDV